MIPRLALALLLAVTGAGLPGLVGTERPAQRTDAIPLDAITSAAEEAVTEGEPLVDEGVSVDQVAVVVPPVAEADVEADVRTTPEALPHVDSDEGVLVDTLVADRVESDVVETADFQTLGVTWPEEVEVGDLDVQVRTRAADGTWSGWSTLPVADEAPDPGSPDAQNAARGGTDPLWVGDSDAVQLSFAARDEAAPEGLELTLVDVPEIPEAVGDAAGVAYGGGDATVTQAAFISAASQPRVISRGEWGARPQVCRPDVATKLVGATVHHTAGSNGYATVADAMRQIRGDQAYHIDGRGWCDLGYNFVVDKWGNLYEGRANSLLQPVIGVHAGGFNTGTVGVSMLGTYGHVPSAATQQAVGQIIGWRLGAYGVNPQSSMTYSTGEGQNSKFRNQTVALPRVFGHRDVAYTSCPGDGGYAALGNIRAIAEQASAPERVRQAQAVVRAMYEDILLRGVDSAGLVTWSGMLASGAGQPALVDSLTSSEEYVKMRITEAYVDVLGRKPDRAGMEHWYQRIRSGSASVDDVKRRFYDSKEYYNRSGGTPEGYVTLLYETMFERPASAREAEYWSGQIDVLGRSEVVDRIWFSFEAALWRSGNYYRAYLDREPDANGQTYWAKVLLGQSERAVRIGIAGSEEYRLLALKTYGS